MLHYMQLNAVEAKSCREPRSYRSMMVAGSEAGSTAKRCDEQ